MLAVFIRSMAAAIVAQVLITGPLAPQTRIRAPLPATQLQALADAGPPVTNLRAEASPTSIRIIWTCPPGATGYEVFAASAGGAPVKVTPAPITTPCWQDLALAVRTDPRFPAPQPSYINSHTQGGLAPRVTQSYIVRAVYPAGYTDAPPLAATTTLWPAPGAFTATLAGRSATLRWSPVPDGSSYEVLRKLDGEPGFKQIYNLPPSGTGYPDPTVLPPGRHAYIVQVPDGTPTAEATLTLPPWPAPSLAATLTLRSVDLSWNAIPGAPAYLVFRQSPGQSAYQQVADVSRLTPTFRDVVPVGTHRYYVQVTGAGDPSAPVSVTAGTPQNVIATVYRGTATVDFRWAGTEDATAVTVQRAPSQAGPFLPIKTQTTKNSWARDDRGLVGGTQYYKIVAHYPQGLFESQVLTVTIPTPPVGPQTVYATSPGPGTVRLSWGCDPEAIGYSLLRGKETEPMEWVRSGTGQMPLVVTTCGYTDTGLWNGATYRYTISARYSDPNTSATASVTVKVAP